MSELDKRKLVARINRLSGQVQSLSRAVDQGETEQFVIQCQAVIAAAKALLVNYLTLELNKEPDDVETQKILLRLLQKLG